MCVFTGIIYVYIVCVHDASCRCCHIRTKERMRASGAAIAEHTDTQCILPAKYGTYSAAVPLIYVSIAEKCLEYDPDCICVPPCPA